MCRIAQGSKTAVTDGRAKRTDPPPPSEKPRKPKRIFTIRITILKSVLLRISSYAFTDVCAEH